MKIFKALRIGEVFLMSGFFMIGSLFSISELNFQILERLIFSFVIVISLIISVYAFNAFCGKEHDVFNRRLFSLKPYPDRWYFIVSVIFLIISIILSLLLLNHNILFYLLSIFLLWVLYSLPHIGLKGIPYTGSILHFFSQILHFNLVYSIFQPVSVKSFFISIYFSFLFIAGHIHHENIDFESDKLSGIRTTTIKLGQKMADRITLILFAIAALYWLFLFSQRFINLVEWLIFCAAFILQILVYFVLVEKYDINHHLRLLFRKYYRVIYLTAGLSMVYYKMSVML